MNFFGVGLPEMLVIFTVALLVFGPRKLPEISRTVAKTMKSLQQASKDFEREMNREISAVESTVTTTPTPIPATPPVAVAPAPETNAEQPVETSVGSAEAGSDDINSALSPQEHLAASDDEALSPEPEPEPDRDPASVA
ncbi:MAG: hypothetical protein OHK0012_17450 [Synechococcales cyanobacterium]